MSNTNTLHTLIRNQMEEKALSLRKLGKRSGIDHATLSRILNGKRKANLSHLQKLSDSLDIELTVILRAAGYSTEIKKNEATDLEHSVETIQNIIKITNMYEGDITANQVLDEINSYQNDSQTEEGRNRILKDFQKKLNKVESSGAYTAQLKGAYSRFAAKEGTARELALMGAALLYFIVTTDLIPDYLLPIGFLDDAVIMQAIMNHMENRKAAL